MSDSKCSCTPGYTCRGLCFTKDALPTIENKKRDYTSKWVSIGKPVSEHQKNRMHIPAIAVNLAKWAYLEEKRCCSENCILKLVEKFTLNKVASAVHLARTDVYHTNANHAHEELRELLKFGRCPDTGDVNAFFDHKKVFESEPTRIKVSCFSDCFQIVSIFLFFSILFTIVNFLFSGLSCRLHVFVRCVKAYKASTCS